MAARTIVQIATDIDQVNARIIKLEADVQAQRTKLTELMRELATTQSETLGQYGMRLVLENAQDGLPKAESKPARLTRHTPDDASRERNVTIRKWAAERGISVPEKGRIPAPLVKQYDAEHST